MELLTPSRMRADRECKRLHYFRYIEGWRAVRTSEAMRFGTLFHLGMEARWKGLGAVSEVSGKGIDAYEQAKVEELLRGYCNRWADDMDKYEVLGVEVKGEAPLLNPETWRPSLTYRLAGKVDLIVRDRQSGKVMVCEHKTAASVDEDYWARLSMDHQISAYTVLAESMGHSVTDILYDVALRPALRPLMATPVESRKYKADGSLYANQRDRDETPDEYRARVRAAIEEEPDRYYQRRVVPRMESQVRDFLADAWMQATAMRQAERLKIHPRNPDACARFGLCSFWQVCSSGLKPEDFPEDYIKGEKHPELMEV